LPARSTAIKAEVPGASARGRLPAWGGAGQPTSPSRARRCSVGEPRSRKRPASANMKQGRCLRALRCRGPGELCKLASCSCGARRAGCRGRRGSSPPLWAASVRARVLRSEDPEAGEQESAGETRRLARPPEESEAEELVEGVSARASGGGCGARAPWRRGAPERTGIRWNCGRMGPTEN
jgi:hypothetical protein